MNLPESVCATGNKNAENSQQNARRERLSDRKINFFAFFAVDLAAKCINISKETNGVLWQEHDNTARHPIA